MIYDYCDAEALRLLRAFHKIDDPEVRQIILAIVEAASRGATLNVIKEGVTKVESSVRMN